MSGCLEFPSDGRTRLNWKPGRWLISCNVKFSSSKSIRLEFNQEIGWRTEEMLVIGQIVETHALDSSSPALPHASAPEMINFRRAVVHDVGALIPSLPLREVLALASTAYVPTEKIAELEFLYWGVMSPPRGPFVTSFPLGLGNVEPDHPYWMIQHMLNLSPDTPLVGPSLSAAASNLTKIIKDREFLVLQHFQGRFLLDATGTKINPASLQRIAAVADKGVTKINFGVEAGEFWPIWNNPTMSLRLPTVPSETNLYNNKLSLSTSQLTLSHYATSRIGTMGRNVGWRLFGRDAPWIYSEILFDLQPDRSVKTRIRTSVDREWTRGGSTTGTCTFNELSLYRRENDPTKPDNFIREAYLPMNGMIPCFVDSGSLVWPGPPLVPSVP